MEAIILSVSTVLLFGFIYKILNLFKGHCPEFENQDIKLKEKQS